MKLLLCRNCQDVFKLQCHVGVCMCGQSGGSYKGDGVNATYFGEHAVPLGFDNSSLVEAVQFQPESGLGKTFEAFVIPKVCPTFVKVEKPQL